MYSISKLQNGITLIRVPIKGTKATTVLAMFPVGSRYEERRISGISHFVEHIMFKGTIKRPTTLDISRELDAVGAQYNAFTSKEYTGYYIKIAGHKQEIAYDILSDMLFNSQFKAEEIEKEKGAIVEELRMYRDNPLMDIESQFESLLFGDTALGWDIGGTDESVRAITRDDLWYYYQKHYSPKNMVLVLAGDIEKNKTKSLLRYFGQQVAPREATTLSFYKNNFTKFVVRTSSVSLAKRVVVKQKKVDQSQVILGFPGLKTNHADRYVASVLSTILGGGMSSRLFTEVRERRGLAYMVRSSVSAYRETGTFYIQAGLDPARIREAVKVIKDELKKIKEYPVDLKELEDAKNNIAGNLALQMEDSHTQANWFAEKFLFAPTIETYEQVVQQLKKVTAHDIQRLANQLFDFKKLHSAAIGSFSKEKFLKLIS
jgi:predicted Zn-dependent peptidase